MYDYDDFSIVPAITSKIRSRKEIDVLTEGYYPLITAYMDTVIDEENKKFFTKNKIRICLPRGSWSNPKDGEFESISMEDAEMISEIKSDDIDFFCIDIANGHMQALIDIIKKFKVNIPIQV